MPRKTITIDRDWLEVITTHCAIAKDLVRQGKDVDAFSQISGIIQMLKEKLEQEDHQ